MKQLLSTISLSLLVLIGNSQTIGFNRDSVQVLQNSDAGVVAFADIDDDGDHDLLITGSPGITTVYKNDGSGNFTAMSQPDIINVYVGAAAFSDVDNDGDMDVLITGNTSSPTATANLYFNDGSGNFTIAGGNAFEPCNSGDIDFGDIDGDNDPDVLITGFNASNDVVANLYRNDGSGVFTLISGTPFKGVSSSSVEFIDVDNDFDLDLLICGADSSGLGTANLYENSGTGSFTLVTGSSFEKVQFGDIAFGDTDNDGDEDILITGLNDSSEYVAKFYVNNGSSFSLVHNTPFPGVFLHSSTFADLNNDGDLDLLHIGNASGGLIAHVYENQGSNNFVVSDTMLIGSYNGSNIVVDLNGDNKLDIVTTGTSFTAPLRAPKIYFNQTVTTSVADFASENNLIQVYPNPSRGTFTVEFMSMTGADLEVLDLSGKQIHRGKYSQPPINVQLNAPPGLYLIRVNADDHTGVKKIFLE